MFRHDEIQARVKRQPFVPLRITDSLGNVYDILHPDLVMVGERSLTIGIPTAPGTSVYQHTVVVALVHIVRLEELPVPA